MFSGAFSHCGSKILFCRGSQVLHDEVVTTNCHKTVSMVIWIKLAASGLVLNGWCFHIRFTKTTIGCVAKTMTSREFGSKFCGHAWVFCFEIVNAILQRCVKASALLAQDIWSHCKVSMGCAWTTLCGRSRVCCSSVAWCLISCRLSGGRDCDQKWCPSTIGEVEEEIKTRPKVDVKGCNCNLNVDVNQWVASI